MTIDLSDKVRKISQEMAIIHANLIEHELESVCKNFSVDRSDLIINYLPDNTIEILIRCSKFKIDFVYK